MIDALHHPWYQYHVLQSHTSNKIVNIRPKIYRTKKKNETYDTMELTLDDDVKRSGYTRLKHNVMILYILSIDKT